MPYITRADGEHFVIPSYRDVLSGKQKSQLKKDILLLSQSYGEYITLQRKNNKQYEVAFSPDPGYLLGESIWHQFRRPNDMIYCEAIPNTTEALLVIVKAGSVYLDGSFPLDSIPEELIIFLTQQNNFEIYTYGDVPISQTPEEGKFSFEASSVKSFTQLDNPVFPTLPLLKMYQLQLVEPVLKAHGIGVFPVGRLLVALIVIGLLWMFWSYISKPERKVLIIPSSNPYLGYNTALTSPAPYEEMQQVLRNLNTLLTIPGWQLVSASYTGGVLQGVVRTSGSQVESLFAWAHQKNAEVTILEDGIYISMKTNIVNRHLPSKIYPLRDVLGNFIDQLASIYPGNHLVLGESTEEAVYKTVNITIKLADVSPMLLALIAEQFKGLPFVLRKISLTVNNGTISGTINLQALGS